ncbi:MADS-box protein SVP [Vitis vinifera]|uniref:MADS-box protein SVP n=1 Tax=Vitis vinifera TaxID=29760 RepID=A0A438GC85_VITVI|nr:MADS-box protein SVP [Vitis vinifera]
MRERERERGAPRLGRGRGLPLQHPMKQRDGEMGDQVKALQSIRCEVSDEVLSTFPHEREERERGAPRLGRGRGLPLQHTMKQRDREMGDQVSDSVQKGQVASDLDTLNFAKNKIVVVVIERHNQHPQTPEKPEPPSLELQLEYRTCAALSKEIAQQTQRLRQMKGEELQVLKIEELTELEELLEAGLCSVVEEKKEFEQRSVISRERSRT